MWVLREGSQEGQAGPGCLGTEPAGRGTGDWRAGGGAGVQGRPLAGSPGWTVSFPPPARSVPEGARCGRCLALSLPTSFPFSLQQPGRELPFLPAKAPAAKGRWAQAGLALWRVLPPTLWAGRATPQGAGGASLWPFAGWPRSGGVFWTYTEPRLIRFPPPWASCEGKGPGFIPTWVPVQNQAGLPPA